MKIVNIHIKQIIYVASMFLFIICIVCGLTLSKRKENNKKDIIETNALPVTGKVIVIDPGHGVPDPGAQASDGTTEEELNLQIALKIQSLLEQSGCEVIMTRADEFSTHDDGSITIREMKNSDLKNRVELGNESQADIYVSIHLNKIEQEQYTGWQTFYQSFSEESIKLSNSIQNNLNSIIDENNTRESSKLDNIYIMKHIEIPITVVECGFLSNYNETLLLKTEDYQNKLAFGIYNGIMDYFLE